jgi:hypothetical protein
MSRLVDILMRDNIKKAIDEAQCDVAAQRLNKSPRRLEVSFLFLDYSFELSYDPHRALLGTEHFCWCSDMCSPRQKSRQS